MGAVRFSLGRTTAADEIAEGVERTATFLQPSAGGGDVCFLELLTATIDIRGIGKSQNNLWPF
jgi:hypothetical protein